MLLAQQEDYWKQRAKQFWPKGGDTNTKFFHNYALSRKRKNFVNALKNEAGDWVSWDNDLLQMMVEYFSEIFTSKGNIDGSHNK